MVTDECMKSSESNGYYSESVALILYSPIN